MRDDDYQRTVKALARETTMSEASVQRIEEKLLSALASRDVAQQVPVWLPPSASARSATARPPEPWRRRSGGRSGTRWAATAAVLMIAASVFVWRMHTPAAVPATAHTAPPSVALPSVKPAEAVAADSGVLTPSAPVRQAAVHRAPASRVISPAGFVELPWTAGLPAFESGEIVRVEVPVASLPAYGFDISSGANRSIEADVLVGQDGFARAMRLVSNSARSTQ